MYNVFTDAASFNNGQRVYPRIIPFSCSAAILDLGEKRVRETQFNVNSSNNNGEILAILLGIKMVTELIESGELKNDKIKIITDSGICYQGLTKWIKNWISNADKNGIWYNSTGEEVANQEIFKIIYYDYILNPAYDIQLLHVRGHLTTNSKKIKALKTFKKMNGYTPTKDYFEYLIDGNIAVDKLACHYLKLGLDNYGVIKNDVLLEFAFKKVR